MRTYGPVMLACLALTTSCTPVGVSGFNGDAAVTDSPPAADDHAPAADAVTPHDAAPTADRGSLLDAGLPTDVASPADTAAPTDLGSPSDIAVPTDIGSPLDIGAPTDRGFPSDTGAPADVGSSSDIPPPVDRPATIDVPTVVDVVEVAPTLPAPPPFGFAPLTVTQRRRDGSGALIDDRRTVFTYDAMRRVDTVDVEVPATAPAWRILTRTAYRYDASGRLDRTETSIPNGPAWSPMERLRYEYDSAGQRSIEHHEVPSATTTAWNENWRYVWEWREGRPTWRRFWQVPSSGGALYNSNYQAFSYETDGRLRGLGRGDRSSSTGSWSDAGGFTYVAWPNGALRAYDFRRNSTTSHADYLYGPGGLVREVSFGARSHTAHLYDARGRLQFVRTYVSDGAGGLLLSDEVELTHTDAGSSYTFALEPHPYATWMMSQYGRGDVLDRYRR
ncbi:MAG: hypothetical protein Q8S73_00455 [Deltaproteobacteria bacterium]|nr:hypothetical protein [Myxococcales bacterium]MDP3212543.1 hypothetical protein [Deltaproteobacteria bacterium]